jgi:ABC-type amino acid transport substrate-binding protein
VIRVGSPLDNPPFNLRNDEFQPDGFDVAVMNELARRLGLKAQFEDYGFDGLLGALQLDQIDAAIAAMAITPQRQLVADFTSPYYQGEDIVLAAVDSPIVKITSSAEVAPLRVGVQRGTVYEMWLLNNLVATEIMPVANVKAYPSPEDAVTALGKGQVDLVVMDREAGLSVAAQGKAKEVGQSLYKQDFAIAVPKGSALAPQLNQALAKLLVDGTVARLAEQYLNIPTNQLTPAPPPPTAAPEPTVAPTPQPAPTRAPYDDMAFVDDLSYDDTNGAPVVQPGQAFKKGWRLKNSGTTTWSPDYQLHYAKGSPSSAAQMGGKPVAMGKSVAPGQTIDVYADLTAPQAPGTYQAWWQMKNAAGQEFAKQIWVKVQVPAPAPPPTATPSASISFWADKNQLAAGECTYLHWRVKNVKAVYLCPPSQGCRGVGGEADEKTCPPSGTVTYQLNAEKPDGSIQSAFQTFQVAAPVSVASIVSFDADPLSIRPGNGVNLWWRLQGNPGRVALLRNGALLADWVPGTSYTDLPPGSNQQAVYELQVWTAGNDKGESEKRQRSVWIEANPAPPQPETRQLYRDACMSYQTLRAGDTLRITLDGQGGTGYAWQEDPNYNGGVLQGSGQPEVSGGGAPGAPESYTFSYLAGPGQTSLTLRYADPQGNVGSTEDVCAISVTVQ